MYKNHTLAVYQITGISSFVYCLKKLNYIFHEIHEVITLQLLSTVFPD